MQLHLVTSLLFFLHFYSSTVCFLSFMTPIAYYIQAKCPKKEKRNKNNIKKWPWKEEVEGPGNVGENKK